MTGNSHSNNATSTKKPNKLQASMGTTFKLNLDFSLLIFIIWDIYRVHVIRFLVSNN